MGVYPPLAFLLKLFKRNVKVWIVFFHTYKKIRKQIFLIFFFLVWQITYWGQSNQNYVKENNCSS